MITRSSRVFGGSREKRQKMKIFFYEAFEEEHQALLANGAGELESGFSWKTIQEYGSPTPPAPIISVRTQSAIPVE